MGLALEDDENAAEDESDTTDPANVLDSYSNCNKHPAFIVIAKNGEVAVIDLFVEKAIRKLKVRWIIEELCNANLNIRVAQKVDSSVDKTMLNKKYSMQLFHESK